jgi:hypothetical protein
MWILICRPYFKEVFACKARWELKFHFWRPRRENQQLWIQLVECLGHQQDTLFSRTFVMCCLVFGYQDALFQFLVVLRDGTEFISPPAIGNWRLSSGNLHRPWLLHLIYNYIYNYITTSYFFCTTNINQQYITIYTNTMINDNCIII